MSCTHPRSCCCPEFDEHAEKAKNCLDLIYDRRTPDYDPLQELWGLFEGVSISSASTEDYPRLAGRTSPRATDRSRQSQRLESDLNVSDAGFGAARCHQQLLVAGW